MPTPPEETKTDIILCPDGTAIYELNEEGDISGTYHGKFVFKCYLDPLSQIAADRLYRDLVGPNLQEANEKSKWLAFYLAHLKYRIIKSPPFWKTEGSLVDGNISDENVISLIASKAFDAELLYKQSLKKKKEEALEKAQSAAQALHESLNPKKKEEEK